MAHAPSSVVPCPVHLDEPEGFCSEHRIEQILAGLPREALLTDRLAASAAFYIVGQRRAHTAHRAH
eukprot:2159631-Alexandrium_andersonii.AAC.1